MIDTVTSSSSNKKYHRKYLLHSFTVSYIFYGLVVILLLAIVFIVFRETTMADCSQQNYPEDASTTSKIPLKQPRVIEIMKWYQPICVIPGKDVLPCLPSQEKIQVEYQHLRANKSDEGESGQKLADLGRIPEFILKAPEMDIKWQSVIRNESNNSTRLIRNIFPDNIRNRTQPSRVYIRKLLNLPVIPVLITHECLPNNLRLCTDYQSNFSLKIIKKKKYKLIQNKSHQDQNSTIEMHRKPYLEVPPKVEIPLLDERNHSSKVIDQPTSYMDHELKINITKSTQNHEPKINTTKDYKSKINTTKDYKSKINTTKDHKLEINTTKDHKSKINTTESIDNIKNKIRNIVNNQITSYMDNELKINIIESTKARKLEINTTKKDTIKPTEEHQPEISTTKPIKNRRKSEVNYIKITDAIKDEINFPPFSDDYNYDKLTPIDIIGSGPFETFHSKVYDLLHK